MSFLKLGQDVPSAGTALQKQTPFLSVCVSVCEFCNESVWRSEHIHMSCSCKCINLLSVVWLLVEFNKVSLHLFSSPPLLLFFLIIPLYLLTLSSFLRHYFLPNVYGGLLLSFHFSHSLSSSLHVLHLLPSLTCWSKRDKRTLSFFVFGPSSPPSILSPFLSVLSSPFLLSYLLISSSSIFEMFDHEGVCVCRVSLRISTYWAEEQYTHTYTHVWFSVMIHVLELIGRLCNFLNRHRCRSNYCLTQIRGIEMFFPFIKFFPLHFSASRADLRAVCHIDKRGDGVNKTRLHSGSTYSTTGGILPSSGSSRS